MKGLKTKWKDLENQSVMGSANYEGAWFDFCVLTDDSTLVMMVSHPDHSFKELFKRQNCNCF